MTHWISRLSGLIALCLLTACGGGGGGAGSSGLGVEGGSGSNEHPVQVAFGGSQLPGGSRYPNALLTSVTICAPGTRTCQTIDRILVDTGSTGLRVMEAVLGIGLPDIRDNTGQRIAECISFADGSGVWGSLQRADVRLADLVAPSVPIQVIGSNAVGSPPGDCRGQQRNTPERFGFNGVLGIGPMRYDCGLACTQDLSIKQYFRCPAVGSCSNTTVPLNQQLI